MFDAGEFYTVVLRNQSQGPEAYKHSEPNCITECLSLIKNLELKSLELKNNAITASASVKYLLDNMHE